MASNPAVLSSLMPGANYSGSSVAVPQSPIVPGGGNPALGGATSPFLPTVPSGTSSFPMTASSGALPNTTGSSSGTSGGSTGLGGANNYSGLWGSTQSLAGLIKGLEKSGLTGGVASVLAQFLQSGAGFNPQVAQALINAMGPQVERGQESIIEQFSAMGNRFGSPAATGLADYQAEVNLNMDQIFSQLYEQSVQNYLEVLMGVGKKSPTFGTTFQQAFASGLGSGAASLITG
jgi:hypothetical protein